MRRLELVRQGLLIVDQRLRCADGAWLWTRYTLVVVARNADGGALVVGYIVRHGGRAGGGRARRGRPAGTRQHPGGRAGRGAPRPGEPDGHFHRSFLSRGIGG